MLATTTTTITSDPGILCFHHCNVKVFCFTLPHICPNCKTEFNELGGEDDAKDVRAVGGSDNVPAGVVITTKLLPFRLPYPFVRATQYPCAIVMRPSTGDFLNDYNNATDLHIAVTTSVGDIVEFDRNGLQRHRRDTNLREWWQSLLVGDVPEPWYDYWDDVLLQICKQSTRWSIAQYDESTNNCYTFVLAFLQALGYEKLSEAARSKTSFCERFIVPRTTTAGKYISLYRKLRDAGIYVHQQQQQHHQQQQQQQQQQRRHTKQPQQQQQQYQQQQRTRVRKNVNGKSGSNSLLVSSKTHTTATTHRSISSSSSNNKNSIIRHTLCTIEE